MTNLQKMEKIIKEISGYKTVFQEVSDNNGRKVSAHYSLFRNDGMWIDNTFVKVETEKPVVDLCKHILTKWNLVPQYIREKIAIIMIEELTGTEHFHSDESTEHFSNHEKMTFEFEWIAANDEWELSGFKRHFMSIPNMWFEYLSLFGKVFKERQEVYGEW